MEKEKACDSTAGHKHQPHDEAINKVEAGTLGNNTQGIISAQKEESIACDTATVANTVEAARKDVVSQENVVGAPLEEHDNCSVTPAPARELNNFGLLNQLVTNANVNNELDEPVEDSTGQCFCRELGTILFRDNCGPSLRICHQQHPSSVQVSQGRHGARLNINDIPYAPSFIQVESMERYTMHTNEVVINPTNEAVINPANEIVMSPIHVVPSDTNSLDVFPNTEGNHDNDWYNSIASGAQMLEELEDSELYGVYSEHPIRSKVPMEEGPTTKEYHTDSSLLGNITKRRAELDPEEAGPSTKRQTSRVPPLNDNDVPMFDCGICLESLPVFNIFHGMECSHMFCVECMATYIEGRVRSGELPIPCPDPECRNGDNTIFLHPERCKKSIDFSVFCSWGVELTERAIHPNLRIYCPNHACRIMLERSGTKTPSKAPCPACKHLMCAACGFDWSTDGGDQHDCAGESGDELMKKLATKCRWKQCPHCKIFVERTTGCRVMQCRCRFTFCYDCGGSLTPGLHREDEMCQCHNARAIHSSGGFMSVGAAPP